MRPEIRAFFHEPTFTAAYLVWDPATKAAALVDPVLDFDPSSGKLSTESVDAMLDAAEAQGLTIAYVLETHVHADHLSGAQRAKARTGASVVIGARIGEVQAVFAPVFAATDVTPDGAAFDKLVSDGATIRLGELEMRVMATPGHTPACVTYLVGDAAFVGDTLFMPDYGTARADFPGGDARTLYRSIRRILDLPPETRVFVGHDYKAQAGTNSRGRRRSPPSAPATCTSPTA